MARIRFTPAAGLPDYTGGYRRIAPVLAVEVAGQDEGRDELGAKARWYLDRGVAIVWLVFPDAREVVAVTPAGEHHCAMGRRLPAHPALPDLEPQVREFFTELE